MTGGHVYRGCGLGPAYQGRYFFADYVLGKVWSIGLTIDPSTGEAQKTDIIEHTADLGGSAMLGNVSAFGLDAAGELYLVNYSAGTIVTVLGAGSPSARSDFDCDGTSDITVFRPSIGVWFSLQSSTNSATYTAAQWARAPTALYRATTTATARPTSPSIDRPTVAGMSCGRARSG